MVHDKKKEEKNALYSSENKKIANPWHLRTPGLQKRKPRLVYSPERVVSSHVSLVDGKKMKCRCNKCVGQEPTRRRTHILQCRTEEELMTGQFDLRLTNQRKGAFHSLPLVEIEYSCCLFILLPQNEKLN